MKFISSISELGRLGSLESKQLNVKNIVIGYKKIFTKYLINKKLKSITQKGVSAVHSSFN